MNVDLRAANIQLAQRYLDAINSWDFDAMRDLLAEDVVFEMPFTPAGFDSRIEGKKKVMEFLVQIPGAVVDGSENLHDIKLDTLASDPNEVIALYKSAMMLVPTGSDYTNDYVTRFTLRDGKITRFAEYYDPIRLIVALGGKVENPFAL